MDQQEAVIYKFHMTGRAASATDETGAVLTPPVEHGVQKASPRDFLDDTRRKLTQDEAASAAGIQWFQYEIERLDSEGKGLKADLSELLRKNEALTEDYNNKRVELEALRGSSAASKQNEILSTLIISAGTAGISVASIYLVDPHTEMFAKTVLGVSILLVAAGIFLRKWK